jgi:hypothetical protein
MNKEVNKVIEILQKIEILEINTYVLQKQKTNLSWRPY